MQRKKLAILMGACAVTLVCILAAATTVLGGTEELPPQVDEPAPAEDTEAPYFVRLSDVGLELYYGGRRSGEPDELVAVDLTRLTGEDRLLLGAGMDLSAREELLMLLESLSAS